MRQPIFYFEKLKTRDVVIVILYLALSFTLLYYYKVTEDDQTRRDFIFLYALGTHFFLYCFNYRSLRNLTVYFIWVLIALGHFYLYLQLKDEPALFNVHGHAAAGLRNTLILLGVFQVLQFVSVKVQNQHLVGPSRTNPDLFGERKVNIVDFMLFLVYTGLAIFLLFI